MGGVLANPFSRPCASTGIDNNSSKRISLKLVFFMFDCYHGKRIFLQTICYQNNNFNGYIDRGNFFCQFRLLTRTSFIGQFFSPVGGRGWSITLLETVHENRVQHTSNNISIITLHIKLLVQRFLLSNILSVNS